MLTENLDKVSERGTNSIEILGWLATGYSISGNETYRDVFWDLINNHGYAENALNTKIDSAYDEITVILNCRISVTMHYGMQTNGCPLHTRARPLFER
jgi:hypothetical protein